MLETTRMPVEPIPDRCGFNSAVAFRTAFTRLVGMAPSRYRKAFRDGRDALRQGCAGCAAPSARTLAATSTLKRRLSAPSNSRLSGMRSPGRACLASPSSMM